MSKKILAMLIGTALFAGGAHAAIEPVRGNILKVLQGENANWGGCMVEITGDIPAAGLNCPANGNWVTFDCRGFYIGASEGKRLYDAAMVAYALNQTIDIFVDDSRKHNGWCLGTRLDLLPRN